MKRWVKCSILLILIFCCISKSWAANPGSWDYFVDHFVTPEGRVVDIFQNRISHSEGQGYGMLLAVTYKDAKTFDLLWDWTRSHLQVRRSDALSVWSWGKRPTGELAPIDYNNASDGDVCIAWALLLAHERWNRSDYLEQATRIIQSIRCFLLLDRYGFTVLLPGYYGYVDKEAVTLNPSYWILPAYRLFGRFDDRLLWERAHADALRLMQAGSKKGSDMIPDWLQLDKDGVIIAPGRPPRFSYEAIRVVLFLVWDHNLAALPAVNRLLDRIEQTGRVPSLIDLKNGTFSSEDGSGGFYAIMAQAAKTLGRNNLADRLWLKANEKIDFEKDDYYSQVLYLFARMGGGP
jgi:endoglucanase